MKLTKTGEMEPVEEEPESLELSTKYAGIALIVDDEVLNCDIAQEILEDMNMKVFSAYSGELALDICNKLLHSKTKIDVIFMDYSMPEMSGDEVTKILRSSTYQPITKDTVIVGVSAHTSPEVKEKCLLAGMNHFENKPFRANRLRYYLELCKLIKPEN